MEITDGLFDLHNVPSQHHPPPPRGTKRRGALGLYVLLLINMWSVRGQWWRGFTLTIKTDATFYLLNGREAERVALDHRRRMLLAGNDVLVPQTIEMNGDEPWMDLFFFERDVFGGREGRRSPFILLFFLKDELLEVPPTTQNLPQTAFVGPLWIK